MALRTTATDLEERCRPPPQANRVSHGDRPNDGQQPETDKNHGSRRIAGAHTSSSERQPVKLIQPAAWA